MMMKMKMKMKMKMMNLRGSCDVYITKTDYYWFTIITIQGTLLFNTHWLFLTHIYIIIIIIIIIYIIT